MYLYRRGKTPVFNAINPENELYDREDVAYWRKANQIHRWFLDNLDLGGDFNCEYVEVSKQDLKNLIDDCKKVLGDHYLAKDILPTQGGFFFGNAYYNDDYFEDLENTITQVQKVIDETDWDNQIVEYSCWW